MAIFDIPQSLSLEDTNTGVIITDLTPFFDCRNFSIFDPAGCKDPYEPSFCFYFTPEDDLFIQLNESPGTIEFFEFDGTPQTFPFFLEGNTIRIEGQAIPTFISCFYVKIDGNCTYGYKRLLCEEGTVTIESTYCGKDFLGFDYDGTIYRNFLRLEGGFEFLGVEHEDRADGIRNIVTRAQYDRYILKIPKLPESIHRLVINVLSGKNVQVNKAGFYHKVSISDNAQEAKTRLIECELSRYSGELTFCC